MKYVLTTNAGDISIHLEDIQVASRITSGLLNEPVVDVTPLVNKGSVNKVFIVEAASQKVVIRLSSEDAALGEYEKEAWCIKQAAARGVPVPSVVGVGRCEGYAYIVQSHISGDDGRVSRAPKLGIWRELGKYAKLIHSISVSGIGVTLSEITQGDARKSWLQYLESNIESLTNDGPLITHKVLTPHQSKYVRSVFAGLRGREFKFGLNHGDISLKNAIIDKHGTITLIDWGAAEASVVPHHELIELYRMNMREGDPDNAQIQAFLDGYGISPAEFKRMRPELETLLVLRAFDELRWAIECNPNQVEYFVSNARFCASYLLSVPV